MSTFKITNITNLLGKRDQKYNSILNIEYVDNMKKKTITIKPNETKYLTIHRLPISAHVMRVKNLITVTEVSAAEIMHAMNNIAQKSQKTVTSQSNQNEITDDMSKKQNKKKTTRKEDE